MPRRVYNWHYYPRGWLLAAMVLLLTACGEPPPVVETVITTNELRVATVNSPTAYYAARDDERGFEYDLVRAFADELGVNLALTVVSSRAAALAAVADRKVHLAAANLPVRNHDDDIVYGYSYLLADYQLIYKRGTRRPRDLKDTSGAKIHVSAGSVAADTLRKARAGLTVPDEAGAIAELEEASTEDLIAGVHEGTLRFAVVDGHQLAQFRALYPSAKVAFTVGEPRALAWAFPAAQDDSLRNLVNAWFTRITTTGRFTTIWDRYFGHKQSFDYVDARTLLRHYDKRLPKYRQYFEGAAEAYGFDWRLLAALSYQESHWNENAKSPTGVRGMMMLTRNTAKALEVDRNDPAQSIVGGAAYLARMAEKIPERIAEPDRTWMSLAAYNVGYGHLEDARVLAARAGLNPDRWLDVASQLPLLSQKKWYSTVKHGYACGREPVRYVNNIRRYYDVLIWLDGGARPAAMPTLGRELIDNLAL